MPGSVFKPLVVSPRVQIVLENLLNGAYCVDTKRRITYWNKAAEEISGYSASEVLGKSCRDDILVHAKGMDILCDTHCPLLATMASAEPTTVSVRLKHKNGYRVPTMVRCIPLTNNESNLIEGSVEIFEETYIDEDVVNRLKELGDFAYLDTLTGIPNRRYMTEALDDALCTYYHKNHKFALIMTDIDFFKRVNDTYGHEIGDLVLKDVARILRSGLRTMDVVSRWGGEEFLILLHNMQGHGLRDKLDFLRRAVASHVVQTEKGPVSVTMSFGCTEPKSGDMAASMIERADACLYKCKLAGRNCIMSDTPDFGD